MPKTRGVKRKKAVKIDVPKAELEHIDDQDKVIFHSNIKISIENKDKKQFEEGKSSRIEKKSTKTNRKKIILKRKLHTWIEPANKKITEFFKPFKIELRSDPVPNNSELSCGGDGGGTEFTTQRGGRQLSED